MKHFLTDMINRVEHQKLNQVAAELPPGWVFGVQLGLRQTHALVNTYHMILIHRHRHVIYLSIHWIDRWWMTWNEYDVIGINQCLCLPKAELNTKNSTRRQLCCLLVEFLVFNSITHVIKKRGVDRSVPRWFICRIIPWNPMQFDRLIGIFCR